MRERDILCLEVGRKIDVFGVHSLRLVIRVGSSSLGLRIDVRHGGQLVDESSICVVVLYIRGVDERLLQWQGVSTTQC